jgi:hypothetical protein
MDVQVCLASLAKKVQLDPRVHLAKLACMVRREERVTEACLGLKDDQVKREPQDFPDLMAHLALLVSYVILPLQIIHWTHYYKTSF